MKLNYRGEQTNPEIGGWPDGAATQLGAEYSNNGFEHPDGHADLTDLEADLYEADHPPISHRKHTTQYFDNRRKLRQLAQERLTQLSDELYKLADEVRYIDPLVAEAIDAAWDATDAALELLVNETE